jgi:tetratricopeptide (TPR) repeat protein
MEYIDGASLEQRIRFQGAIPPDQVVDIITQLGKALDYAHQRGFVHRDIKPGNVLIDRSGRAVLTDFGIVKALRGSGVTAQQLTQAGSVVGTPHYMSPEQVKDEPLDHRSDLYSLGIVCYEMLSGQVPFDGTTTHSILYAQVHSPPPHLRETVGPPTSPGVEKVVNKVLAKNPEARYRSAGEFAEALSQAVTGTDPSGALGLAPAIGQEEIPSRQTPYPVASPPNAQPKRKPSRWPALLLGIGVLGIVLTAAVILGALWLGSQDSLDETLAEAQTALADGRHDEAIQLFMEALDEDPDNVEALKGIGQAYEEQEDWPRAAVWYEKWTQVAPDDAEARVKLGSAYYEQERYEDALAQLSQATALQPDLAMGWKKRAQSEYALKQYEAAVPSLLKWKEFAPEDEDHLYLLGWSYYRLGRYGEAVAEFEQLLQQNPDWADGYRGLASSYYDQKDYAKALEVYQAWASLEPDSVHAHTMTGWSFLQMDQPENAVEAFKRALALEENAGIYLGLGRALYDMKDFAGAAEAYRSNAELSPDQPEPYWRLGWAYYQMEENELAREAFEKAISLDDSIPQAYSGLGYTQRRLENHAQALENFQAWAKLVPDQADPYTMIGWSQFALREYAQAVDAFAQSLEIEENARTHYAIGESYRRLGDCEQATPHFERALELDPSMEDAAEGLSKCQNE